MLSVLPPDVLQELQEIKERMKEITQENKDLRKEIEDLKKWKNLRTEELKNWKEEVKTLSRSVSQSYLQSDYATLKEELKTLHKSVSQSHLLSDNVASYELISEGDEDVIIEDRETKKSIGSKAKEK